MSEVYLGSSSGWVEVGGGGGGVDPTALHWQGPWSGSTQYAEGDIVSTSYGMWVANVAPVMGSVPGQRTMPSLQTPATAAFGGVSRTAVGIPSGASVPWTAWNNDIANQYDHMAYFYIETSVLGNISWTNTGQACGTDIVKLDGSGSWANGFFPPTTHANYGSTPGRVWVRVYASGGASSTNHSGILTVTPTTAVMSEGTLSTDWSRLAPVIGSEVYAPVQGYTKDRAFNPETAVVQEVARVLGTLIDDLKLTGVLKQ